MITSLAKEAKMEWKATKVLAISNPGEFKKRIRDFIEFHSTVKQLRKSLIQKFKEHKFKYCLHFQIGFGLRGDLRVYNYRIFFMVSFIDLWFVATGSNRIS